MTPPCSTAYTDVFFDPKYYDYVIEEYCSGCPLVEECLRKCLSDEEEYGYRSGVWGGTTPKDRNKLTNTRRKNLDMFDSDLD